MSSTKTVTAIAMLVGLAACGNGTTQAADPDAPVRPTDAPAALSDAERARLVFMREEEKLARDVYDALDGNGQPFVNVQTSEQRHMDELLVLLDRYAVPDPAQAAVGRFTDADLQALHDALVTRGGGGALSALEVGCVIEDLDLRDLDVARAESTHADLDQTYDFLALGSRNHLRAFYGRLTAAGGSYTPQYIDQATFDAIVSSPHEQPSGKVGCPHPGGGCGRHGQPGAFAR